MLVYAVNTKPKAKKNYITSYFFHEQYRTNVQQLLYRKKKKKKKPVLYKLKTLTNKHKNQKQKKLYNWLFFP
jgi:hypothetical protein